MTNEITDSKVSLFDWKEGRPEVASINHARTAGEDAGSPRKGSRLKDLTGQVFGRLTVLELLPDRRNGKAVFRCACSCGKETVTLGKYLSNGDTTSCGCYMKEVVEAGTNTRHGMAKSKTYRCWCSMKERCLNPNNKNYPFYGAIGITVCERWMEFKNFLADLGEAGDCELDRFPNRHGNYEPGNVRWATEKEQSRNRDYCKTITYHGVTKLCAEWADELKMPVKKLYTRIFKQGWTLEMFFKPSP